MILNYYFIFDEISLSKQLSPRWDATLELPIWFYTVCVMRVTQSNGMIANIGQVDILLLQIYCIN